MLSNNTNKKLYIMNTSELRFMANQEQTHTGNGGTEPTVQMKTRLYRILICCSHAIS